MYRYNNPHTKKVRALKRAKLSRVPGTSRLEKLTASASLELDVASHRLLTRLALNWRVSEEQAVRRALEQASRATNSQDRGGRLEAFNLLRRRLGLTPSKAQDWQKVVYEARR
jgi:hypothetical protein